MKLSIFVALYIFFATLASATPYYMSFQPGATADSIEWEFRKNGEIAISGQRTNTIGWDTTFTWSLVNDTFYQIIHYTYYPGLTYPVSSVTSFGRGASNGGWFVTAQYGYLLDSLIINLYTNGILTSSDTLQSVYGNADTISVSSPNQYSVIYLSKVNGANFQSYTQTIQTDTSTAIIPPGSNMSAVTFSVVNNSGNPEKNIWVSVSMVGGNRVDSSGNAVVNTIQTKPTDANGLVTFNLIWSSYLIPSAKYFIKVGQGVGRYYEVPRQSSVLVDFSTL